MGPRKVKDVPQRISEVELCYIDMPLLSPDPRAVPHIASVPNTLWRSMNVNIVAYLGIVACLGATCSRSWCQSLVAQGGWMLSSLTKPAATANN
jgi:hypothetical protein